MTAAQNSNPGCLTAIFSFFNPRGRAPATLPYKMREDYLSPAELSFYKILTSTVQGKMAIQSKVRLGDIFKAVHPDRSIWQRYTNQINQKHVDFLLCDPASMKPVLGIELDDASHGSPSRQARDNFVDQVFQVGGIPLIHIPAKQSYNTQSIADQIGKAIGIKSAG